MKSGFLEPLFPRWIARLSITLGALWLAGCASLNSVSSSVSTYGPWPADRQPGTFAFERLPSQQTHPERQQLLEDAARGAVESAGFRAAPDASDASYLMQVGARVTSDNPWVYNAPLFWRNPYPFGFYGGYHHGWGRRPLFPFGPWGGYYDDWPTPYFDREVAIVIRDRKTGQLLYEARATNTGPSPAIDYLLPVMFSAALKDFPKSDATPRIVTLPLTPH